MYVRACERESCITLMLVSRLSLCSWLWLRSAIQASLPEVTHRKHYTCVHKLERADFNQLQLWLFNSMKQDFQYFTLINHTRGHSALECFSTSSQIGNNISRTLRSRELLFDYRWLYMCFYPSRSFKVIQVCTNQKHVYDFKLVISCNLSSMSPCLWSL